MDFLNHYRHQTYARILLLLLGQLTVMLVIGWFGREVFSKDELYILLAVLGVGITVIWAALVMHYTTGPVEKIWQAVQHVAPHGDTEPAPDLKTLRLGHDLVATLVNHIYQMASVVDAVEKTNAHAAQDIHTDFIANVLPLPLLVVDKNDTILYTNEAARQYFGESASDASGQNLYTKFSMSFSDEQTLHAWLKTVRSSAVTANKRWERVRIGLPGQKDTKQFDLAAHYNKDNPMGYETILVLFDHTEVYSQDDQAMSFVALSVHELRTPITLLRGYIEVFDEELGPTLSPELKPFMEKMNAAAQQLAAFVDNILNVAKIEDNQLTLQLHEEKWEDVLRAVVQDMRLQAGVRGIAIKATVAKGLPTVGVDRYSIYEVVANLLDNAIKYSKGTKEIHLTAVLNKEGLVETSIKDFGLGIDAAILPRIFDKFYRNHRNRAQIGGTGLGLYLSRAIVQAHGGQIRVSSKVDEGSTFTFTVVPYAKLAETGKAAEGTGITREAHSWIKNHSMYRE